MSRPLVRNPQEAYLEQVLSGAWTASDILDRMCGETSMASSVGSGVQRPLGTSSSPDDDEENLTEATFNLDVDVEFLFSKFNYPALMDTLRHPTQEPKLGTYFALSSGELRSEDAKKAHTVNPVTIRGGAFSEGSYYCPTEKIIQVSLNVSAIRARNRSFSGDTARLLQNEFTPERIKGTIYHELSHWVSDSLHNARVLRNFQRANELGSVAREFHGPINASPLEIDAQIHALKAFKAGHPEWDTLTLRDVFFLAPSIYSVWKTLPASHKDPWQRALVSRMSREGLLGKNMRQFVHEASSSTRYQ